jgi:hypothetical protein
MSTQEKGEEGFELVTSASLRIVHSQLSYPLRTPEKNYNISIMMIYLDQESIDF